MKITKQYEGLKRLDNGDYVLDGDLVSEDNIEIELDDRLIVSGKLEAKKSIIAVCGIDAGWGINAGEYIEAKRYIHSGKRIFAGISVYHTSQNCKNQIKCAELRNGEIAYGELVITKDAQTECAEHSNETNEMQA